MLNIVAFYVDHYNHALTIQNIRNILYNTIFSFFVNENNFMIINKKQNSTNKT